MEPSMFTAPSLADCHCPTDWLRGGWWWGTRGTGHEPITAVTSAFITAGCWAPLLGRNVPSCNVAFITAPRPHTQLTQQPCLRVLFLIRYWNQPEQRKRASTEQPR